VLCELGWEDEAQACLVIDAPGEEFAILEAIVKHDVLRHIGSLVLYAPNAPLYEGARSQQESLELLNTCGFELLGESGNKGDVERIAVLKLNKWKQLSHRLQNECEALRKRLDEQNSEIDHLRRQLERI